MTSRAGSRVPADGPPNLAAAPSLDHPRRLGWVGTTALAMGGSNQSLFILGALLVTQGTAAVPLLAVGLLLAWAALPGWTELVCLWPNRVGGIAGACSEAFRPYSPLLANLTGVCYWWGWVPTCGLTAILSASALHAWYLPGIPTRLLAAAIVAVLTGICLCGLTWVSRLATVIATVAAGLALVSGLAPLVAGHVDADRASHWSLAIPFPGHFGAITSAMAGLYLVGFAAPAFEAAACHVGETRDPTRNVPRAMFASAGMATVYFVLLPVVWLGVLGPHALTGDLAQVLGPTFGPVFGSLARSAAVWFVVANMFHGTLQPLTGAARTLSQLSEDGLLPRSLARRNRNDVPWVATVLTAGMSIAFMTSGDPPSIIAAANFTYLIGICMPSVAVWLLRRDASGLARPWRAPRFTIGLGLTAAGGWGVSTLLGFEQYGLTYVILGLGLAYSGSAAFAWRRRDDRRRLGESAPRLTVQVKLTGAMLAVGALDGVGYVLAVDHIHGQPRLVTTLQDIFVGVALLTVGAGLVLPGMVAHQARLVRDAARTLETGTLAELTRSMHALGAGNLDAPPAALPADRPVPVRSRDELGQMAASFNRVQAEAARAATALTRARAELTRTREELRHQANTDHLTGVGNRRWFERESASRLADEHGPLALVLVDLDDFKAINDSRGHAVGDEVLRQTATLLAAWASAGSIVGRLGGDEFAVLLCDIDESGARAAARRLLVRFATDVLVVDEVGHRVRVGASLGVAPLGAGEGIGIDDLLVAADLALYDAKRSGRGRLSIGGPQSGIHGAEMRTRQDWAESLRDAVAEDRFELWGQPIAAVDGGGVGHYEVLLRMRTDAGALVLPGSFLGLAEHLGLIGDIDRWVVSHALALMRDRHAAGTPVSLSVNLSGLSVADPRMLDHLRRELGQGGFDPTALVIEVTETAAIADVTEAQTFARELTTLGPVLALDDFGAGFGSFNYVKNLPFGFLKIDGNFVRELPSSVVDRELVKSIVALARGLGMKTVAEFVESEEIFSMLAGLGVDLAQGYHIGRPEPLPALLARHSSAPGPPGRPAQVERRHPGSRGASLRRPA